MHVTDKPEFSPAICPVTGLGEGTSGGKPRRFIDFEVVLPDYDSRLYVSEAAVREAATLLGVDDEWQAKIDELNKIIAQKDEEISELERIEAAAEYSLRHFGSRIHGKPGPKPQRKVEA